MSCGFDFSHALVATLLSYWTKDVFWEHGVRLCQRGWCIFLILTQFRASMEVVGRIHTGRFVFTSFLFWCIVYIPYHLEHRDGVLEVPRDIESYPSIMGCSIQGVGQERNKVDRSAFVVGL